MKVIGRVVLLGVVVAKGDGIGRLAISSVGDLESDDAASAGYHVGERSE